KICVGVKEVEKGVFSTFANNELQVGDTLEIMESHGRFTFTGNPDRQSNYVAIAAGSGITPILSIITNALEKEQKSKFILSYGKKTKEGIMLLSLIHDLKKMYAERLHVEMV